MSYLVVFLLPFLPSALFSYIVVSSLLRHRHDRERRMAKLKAWRLTRTYAGPDCTTQRYTSYKDPEPRGY